MIRDNTMLVRTGIAMAFLVSLILFWRSQEAYQILQSKAAAQAREIRLLWG